MFGLDLLSNPMFAGIVGGAGMTALMYQAKNIPVQIFNFAKRQFTTYIEIDNSEEMFERMMLYLTTLPDIEKSRWLRMVEYYDEAEQKWLYKTTFGSGWHILKDDGVRFLLHRQTETNDKGGMTLRKRETLTIRTLGRNQQPIKNLVKKAENVYRSSESIRVYIWHEGSYMLVDRKPIRNIGTVFIPFEQKNRILTDLNKFISAKDDYRKKGIPYKRGYLFKGPPGTGKTTLAFVMACQLHRPMYIINLNTAGGDTGIQAAFNFIEPGSVVVIEDVDSSSITHQRESAPVNDNSPDASKKITLSGLLNAIDGIGARDNRILILTSNHAEKLDKALIRPGRVDVIETIGLMEKPEAIQMATAFGKTENWINDNVSFPVSPAYLQNELLKETA